MHVLENENISIRVDNKDKMTTIETNSSGLLASYVSVRLNENEIEELIEAYKKQGLN